MTCWRKHPLVSGANLAIALVLLPGPPGGLHVFHALKAFVQHLLLDQSGGAAQLSLSDFSPFSYSPVLLLVAVV